MAFSSGFMVMRRQENTGKSRRKICQPKILYPVKIFFKNAGKIKTFSNKRKLKEFVVKMPGL